MCTSLDYRHCVNKAGRTPGWGNMLKATGMDGAEPATDHIHATFSKRLPGFSEPTCGLLAFRNNLGNNGLSNIIFFWGGGGIKNKQTPISRKEPK